MTDERTDKKDIGYAMYEWLEINHKGRSQNKQMKKGIHCCTDGRTRRHADRRGEHVQTDRQTDGRDGMLTDDQQYAVTPYHK